MMLPCLSIGRSRSELGPTNSARGAGGLPGPLAVVDDLNGARRRCVGVVTQGDGLADQDGVDLAEPAMQAHRAVFHHPAFGLEQEQVVEVEASVADRSGG